MMIGQRRNQALLNSFLNIGNEDEVDDLFAIQEESKKKIQAIDEELKTMKLVAADFKVQKFMSETKAQEYQAQMYLREFNDDVPKAVQKFKERQKIVKEFAEKNKIPEHQAEDILR